MPTVGHSRRSRPRAAVSRCWRTCSTRSFIFAIRVRMIRRSVSSWLSPGPREPIPPWVRDRWVHSLVRRGSWYSSWASSTWRRPSWVWAWSAKMSRISRLRSMTLTLSSSSRARCWAGDSSSSAIEDVEAGLALGRRRAPRPCPCRRTSSGRRGGGSATRRRRPRRRRSSARLASSASESCGGPAVLGAGVDGDEERLLDGRCEVDQMVCGHGGVV